MKIMCTNLKESAEMNKIYKKACRSFPKYKISIVPCDFFVEKRRQVKLDYKKRYDQKYRKIVNIKRRLVYYYNKKDIEKTQELLEQTERLFKKKHLELHPKVIEIKEYLANLS